MFPFKSGNLRIATVCVACTGLITSACTAIFILIGLGERHLIVDRQANEVLFSLFCVLYTMIFMVKSASEILLACGAYKVSYIHI